MSCWEMLVEKWIYKCANLWCILDVFFKTWNGENVQRCWRDVDVEGGVAHRDSLCQWDVKPGGGWWDGRDARGADGDTALVILCLCWVGVGTATYQASALDSNVIKNVVERVGCRAWGQWHRVCSERVCLSRVSEKRRKEGVGWTWCVFDKMHMLFICGGSMSRVSTHARSLQLLISTLSLLSYLTGCNNKITNECS